MASLHLTSHFLSLSINRTSSGVICRAQAQSESGRLRLRDAEAAHLLELFADVLHHLVHEVSLPFKTRQPCPRRCIQHKQLTWTSICSLLLASLVTEAPQANFLPNFLDASASLIPNKSRPVTVVTHLRLLRVARSINTWVRVVSQSPPTTLLAPAAVPPSSPTSCCSSSSQAPPPAALPPLVVTPQQPVDGCEVTASRQGNAYLQLKHAPQGLVQEQPAVPQTQTGRPASSPLPGQRTGRLVWGLWLRCLLLGVAPLCCTRRTRGAGHTRGSTQSVAAPAWPLCAAN